jgi:hypothetical protein
MNLRWVFFTLCWLAVAVSGSALLLFHSQTPGEAGRAPQQWPDASRIGLAAGRSTLVMFAHPKCPCTRASIEELSTLMARSQDLVEARVVFFQPEDATADWAVTDAWKKAAAIPGVAVQTDTEGREALNFQVSTSGHVVLYDANGRLQFTGGITEARGHAGDNDGRSAVVQLLRHGESPLSATPVFGCPIRKKATEEAAVTSP